MTKEEKSPPGRGQWLADDRRHPCLTKPRPIPPSCGWLLKATVASVEIKKPAGKWEKVANESYSKITAIRRRHGPAVWVLRTISA